MDCWRKVIVTTFLLVLVLCNSSEATKWFEYDHEDGVVGNSLPNDWANGPYWFEYNPPGKYQSDAIRGKFAEFVTVDRQNAWLNVLSNPNGMWGTPWSNSNPVKLVVGTTYYLGAFFRFERINGLDIWHDTFDFDKLLEMRGPGIMGGGFRWIIASGARYVELPLHGFTFLTGCGKSAFPTCQEEGILQNQNGYSGANPYRCEYERWHAVVLGIEYQYATNGRVRVWINGTLVTDYTVCPTGSAGATINLVELSGTIGQPGYNAPAHKRQFDRIILTDNWQDIINGGYLTANPPPAAPVAPRGLRIIPPGN